jgi:hypothetical protein
VRNLRPEEPMQMMHDYLKMMVNILSSVLLSRMVNGWRNGPDYYAFDLLSDFMKPGKSSVFYQGWGESVESLCPDGCIYHRNRKTKVYLF